MLLFPYVFGRLGGESIEELENMKSKDGLKVAAEIILLNSDIEKIRFDLIQILYCSIQSEEDIKCQNMLLNLKRDIFNNRTINASLVKINEYCIDQKFLDSITLYLNSIKDRKNLLDIGQILYQQEVNKSLGELYKLCNNANLKNGFLFSSEKLSKIVSKNDFEYFRKQKKKDILAFTKYATRSTTKTTPFSTLNEIFCLKIEDNSFGTHESVNKSFIWINNSVFLYLKRLLLYLPETKGQMQVNINSSLIEVEGFYHLFINIDNNDHVKKIRINSICNFIKESVCKIPNITFNDLTKLLQTQTDENISKIREYLEGLIKEGFLVTNYPVSIYTKDWPIQLSTYIKKIKCLNSCKTANLIIDFIEKLEDIRLVIESDMDFLDRRSNLFNAYNLFAELKKKIIEEYPDFPFHFSVENIAIPDLFYEDKTCMHNSKIENVDLLISQISEAQMSLALFDEKKQYRELIAQSIIKNFNCPTIPLYSFFETFCNNKIDFEALVQKKVQYIISAKESQVEIIKGAIESLNLTELDIKSLLTHNSNPNNKMGSGIYFQTLEGKNGTVCILNSESYGWGKNISRFLNFVDDKVIADIITCIKIHHPGSIVADVHDASVHNTNVYPKLTDYVIEIPGSEDDTRMDVKIPLNELIINVDGNEIFLSWKNMKVIPVHFSMENMDRKSSLVKLLDIFSMSNISGLFTIQIIEAHFRAKLQQSDLDIIELPRIVYGENIVVSRKKWFVKKQIFPNLSNARIGGKESYSAFLKVIDWKNKNGIPDEIFIKLSRVPAKTRNLHKPLYVNFKIFILIENFLSMIDFAEDIVEISEMLPNSDQIKKNGNGKKYVCEYIMNIV